MVVNGALSKEDYSVTCIVCGSQDSVALVPHRVKDKVSGIYCFCEKCFPTYAGATLRTEWIIDAGEFAPKDAVEALISSTNSDYTAALRVVDEWTKQYSDSHTLITFRRYCEERLNAAGPHIV